MLSVETIQVIYLCSASIGIAAMIPQIRRLLIIKQSDGLSLTTWGTWACCQIISFTYAVSINARAYMLVSAIWIGFYWTMVFLIIKYRKRRSLLDTVMYWMQRGREERDKPLLHVPNPLSKTEASDKV